MIRRIIKRFLYFWQKRKCGFISQTAWLKPTVKVYRPKNLYMYDNTSLTDDTIIMNTRAKFIMKEGSASAIGLLVITGNHMKVK